MLAESYTVSRRRPDLHLQAAPGRQVPQRPGADGRRRRNTRSSARSTRRRRAPAQASSPSIDGFDDFTHGKTRPPARRARRSIPTRVEIKLVAARRHLPARDGAQFRLRRAEGGGREGGRRLRQAPGRHRRLHVRRNGSSASGSCSSATPTSSRRASRISTSSRSRSARSRWWRSCACRRARSTSLGDGIPPAKFNEVMRDPELKKDVVIGPQLADRLRHDERQPEALRRPARPPGRQHGDQQGRASSSSSTAAPRRPTRSLPPGMPGYDKGYKGYRLRPGEGEGAAEGGGLRRRLLDRALRQQHRPEPAHRPGDPAGPGRGRHQGRDQVAGAGRT